MEEGNPDWAYLPSVAVDLISEKINFITDYIRFRAVCSPWRSVSPPKPRHLLSPQLPWLMIPYSPFGTLEDGTKDDGLRLFYDLWESKMRKLPLPETVGRSCCGSYHGWLLLVAPKGSELFLLNPLTRARVDLPPFTVPVAHIWDEPEPGENPWMFANVSNLFLHHFAISKVTFSSDLTDPKCIIMVYLRRTHGIFFCRVGDQGWTQVGKLPEPRAVPADATYHNGFFYLMHDDMIECYHISKQREACIYLIEPELQGVRKSFLVGKSGLYLVAVQFPKEEEGVANPNNSRRGRLPKQIVDMYHISNYDGLEIKPVTGTSDTTIFYGDNFHYLAVCADAWNFLDGGCIYMQYRCMAAAGNDEGKVSYSILFSKLDDGKTQPLVGGLGEEPRVKPPASAMWFQPSFG